MSMNKRVIIKNAFGLCGYKRCFKKEKKKLDVYMFGYSSELCEKHYNELVPRDELKIINRER